MLIHQWASPCKLSPLLQEVQDRNVDQVKRLAAVEGNLYELPTGVEKLKQTLMPQEEHFILVSFANIDFVPGLGPTTLMSLRSTRTFTLMMPFRSVLCWDLKGFEDFSVLQNSPAQHKLMNLSFRRPDF